MAPTSIDAHCDVSRADATPGRTPGTTPGRTPGAAPHAASAGLDAGRSVEAKVDTVLAAVAQVITVEPAGVDRPARAVDALVTAVGSQGLGAALQPGSGATRQRWRLLGAVARLDLAAARLVEGHLDAAAILAECASEPEPQPVSQPVSEPGTSDAVALDPWDSGARWGVWAAHPPTSTVRAERTPAGWQLTGRKPWCSGAGSLTHALISVDSSEATGERRLFAVALDDAQVSREDTWQAVGMRDSDSGDVLFDAAPAVPVGAPGWYVRRPGFPVGGMGVAACWLGGARGVADRLWSALHEGRRDPHALAHLGSVARDLAGAHALLDATAALVDGGATGTEELAQAAGTVRAAAADVAERTVVAVGHALGAGPLCLDAEHAQRVADLEVFIRQHHAERDLAALGAAVADQGTAPWVD